MDRGGLRMKENKRYPMCKDQPAQIDCRREHCKWHKNANCTNISPAITLQHEKAVCWSFEEDVYYVSHGWVLSDQMNAMPFDNKFSGTKEECLDFIDSNKPKYCKMDIIQIMNQISDGYKGKSWEYYIDKWDERN